MKYKKSRKTTPSRELKKEVKKVNWRLWLTTLLAFGGIFALYQVLVYFEFKWVMPLYSIALIILAVIYIILRRGQLGARVSYDRLPQEWSEEKKQLLLSEQEKIIKRSKPILIPIIGILLTLAFDIVWLFYIDPLL